MRVCAYSIDATVRVKLDYGHVQSIFACSSQFRHTYPAGHGRIGRPIYATKPVSSSQKK